MANDRIYLLCGDCHAPGLSVFDGEAADRPACIIKVWGIEPRAWDGAQHELARF